MEYKLKEILNFHNHKRVPLSKMQRNQKSFSKYPYYGAQGIIDYIDNYIFDGTYLLIAEDGENLRSRKNNIATIAKNKFWVNNHAHILSVKENFNIYYILYLINLMDISGYLTGTVQPKLSKKNLESVILNIPEKNIQDKIGDLIVNIENKINTNNKLIANLEELSQTLFKHWFVDFEFPDKDGNPYKSSGGEMIDSELGEIPKHWSIKTVKEIAESFNSIRKPLSKIEREKRESIYPYYGATKIIDYVDNYIFDGKYILVGEDGTVQTETGNPFIQYVWGKFWVSNHAHILKGKLISDELLMLYLKNTNVAPYITGAVQPKLNKKNLNSIKFVIADKETIIKFENSIKSYFQKIRILNKENKKLIELRDTLLPKLMFGEIEIPDDIEVNSDELSI